MQYNKVAIITPRPDPASRNIRARLLEMFPFEETNESFDGERIHEFQNIRIYAPAKDPINCEHIDKQIDADLFCFATKHRAASGTHSLSVHVPGNWGKAELGGVDRKLCVIPASVIRTAFLELQRRGAGSDHEITLESTHHGPLIDKPCFFIEIGSDETQWSREEPARIIAETIISTMEKRNEAFPTVMVLGGGHYNQLANRILLGTNYAVGHICPKYALASLDLEMMNQGIERSAEKVEMVILDWKGLGDQKDKVRKLSEEIRIPFERSRKILHEEE